MRPPTSRVADCRRLATLTTSPITVNSTRWSAPIVPITTGPQCTPTATRTGSAPRAVRLAFQASISCWRSRAQAMARAAPSPRPSRPPKVAMKPSPRNLSRVPAWRNTTLQLRSRKPPRSAKARSGPSPSLMPVKPITSANSTATTRVCGAPKPAWARAASASATSGET